MSAGLCIFSEMFLTKLTSCFENKQSPVLPHQNVVGPFSRVVTLCVQSSATQLKRLNSLTLKLIAFTKLHHCFTTKINVSISKKNGKYSLSLIEILNVKIFIQLNRCIFSQATQSDWTCTGHHVGRGHTPLPTSG